MSQIHKMKLLAFTVLAVFSTHSMAGSNVIRVMAPINYVDPDTWSLTSPMVSAWGDGSAQSCEQWAPDPMAQPYGSTFDQLQTCLFEQHRTVQPREVNQNGEVRNKGKASVESQQVSQDHARSLSWISLADVISKDPDSAVVTCDDWTPGPDTVDWGKSFQQTRSCIVTTPYTKQAREAIITLDLQRNIGQPIAQSEKISKQEARTIEGLRDVWKQADPVISAWADGQKLSCDAWTPDPLTQPNGSTFQQSQTCYFEQTRTVQTREVNQDGEFRDNGVPTSESQKDARSTGRSLTWLAIKDMVRNNGSATSSCGEWSPDAGTIDWGNDFNQTRTCNISTPFIKQGRESIESLGIARDVGKAVAYNEATTKVESRVTQGTQDIWAGTTSVVGNWVDGANSRCDAWTPDPMAQANGATFDQQQICYFPQTRTVQAREINQAGTIRNKGVATSESQQSSRTARRSLTWASLPDEVKSNGNPTTNCGTWMPVESTVDWGKDFTQTRSCAISTPFTRQSKEAISSLSLVRNIGNPVAYAQDTNKNESRITQGTKDIWSATTPILGSWVKAADSRCDAWTPDPLTKANGSTFQQNQTCYFNQSRSVQAREVNQSGTVRNNGAATTETQQASRVDTRSLTWLAIANEINANGTATTTCQAWTPDVSTVDWGTNFTQTRACDVSTPYTRQARETIASLGLTRNVGSAVAYSDTAAKNEYRTIAGTKDVWTATSPSLGSWVDGANTRCDAWTPDPLTKSNGSTFQQTQTCYFPQTRSVQAREINQAGTLRNSGAATTETQASSRNTSRSLTWVALADEIKANGTATTSCAAWTPATTTVDWGQSFTQTRSCNVSTPYTKQARESISSLGLERNVGSAVAYGVASTRNETQSATGTRDVWTLTTPQVGAWVNGADTRCDAWTPDPLTRANGSTFTQTQSCYFPQTRSVQAREVNQSGVVRNSGSVTTETQQGSRSSSRNLSWVAIVDDVKTNGSVTDSCSAWSPDPSTVEVASKYTQTRTCTATTPYVKQSRESIASLSLTRNVGSPVAYTQSTPRTETQSATGIKPLNRSLAIINPVAGVNGIYSISDGNGGSYKAYVDMTTNGGNWILLGRWVNTAATKTWTQIGFKGGATSGWTDDATNYPVIKNGVLNTSDQIMYVPGHPSWIAGYGAWQTFNTFAQGTVIGEGGFLVNTPTGTATLHGQSGGWKGTTSGTSIFGIWTQWGNGGSCGGDGRVGSVKMCPIAQTQTTNNHYDLTYTKQIYLKATN